MAENSKIEWTTHTWNAWEGCEKVSPGCANCYAERRDKQYHNGEHWGPNGTRKMMSENYWRQPVRWNKDAEKTGIRPRVFCSSLADVFEDRPELEAPRRRLFKLIQATPNLDWLLLTKRPENIHKLTYRAIDPFDDPDCEFNIAGEPNGLDVADFGELYPNVWLGTTVENQEQADRRIPELLKVPAKVRFLSCEPLLSGLDLSKYLSGGSQDDNQRNGSFGTDSNRCAVCGQAWQGMAAQGNYAGIGNFGPGDSLRTEASGRGTIREGRLSQGSSDNWENSIYRTGASDCLDDVKSVRNSNGMRDQSQGRSERQQPAGEPRTGDSIRELASLTAYAGQLPEQKSDGGEANTRAGFGNPATQRREDHASCSNCGNIQGQHGNSSEYSEPLKVGMDSRSGIHWVIAGGESGPNARPMNLGWARRLRDQCTAANVPLHFKQHGEWLATEQGAVPQVPTGTPVHFFDGGLFLSVRVGKHAAGRTLDGRTWDEFPNQEAR